MAPPRPTAPDRIRRIIGGVTLVLVVCAAGGARADSPRKLAYDPEQPIPAGYHVEHRTRYGLAISGIALFAAVYVPTAAAAWYDSGDGTPLYVVPVLGPLFISGAASAIRRLSACLAGPAFRRLARP